MKAFVCVLFAAVAALALVTDALPRNRREADIVIVPLERAGVSSEEMVDTIPSSPWLPNFGSLFNSWSFPTFNFGDIFRDVHTTLKDLKDKGNTTSTTKVIDGNIVTVNDTTYEDEDGHTLIHIKIVDVKPSTEEPIDKTEDAMSTTAAPADASPETVQNKDEESNEILPQNDNVAENFDYNNHEDFERLDTREFYMPEGINEVDNDIEVFDSKPIDLQRDTLVNQLMSEHQSKSGLVMIDPDAELFDVEDGEIVKTYYNPFQRFQKIVT